MPNRPSAVLSSWLRNLSEAERIRAAAAILQQVGNDFDDDVAGLLRGPLESAGPEILAAWPDHPIVAWIAAQSAMDSGDTARALAAWDRFFSLSGGRRPAHLFEYARCLTDDRRFEDAAFQLRLALWQDVPYALLARFEKLIQRIESGVAGFVRQCRIAVLGTSTTTFLVPVLRALCLRDRIQATFYEGPFGAIQQEVLDPASGLARFRPNIVLLVMNSRDLGCPAITADPAGWLDSQIDAMTLLWSRLSDSLGCHVIQHSFDPPPVEPFGYPAEALPGGRARLIENLNDRLRQAAPRHVSILDTGAVVRRCGARVWSNDAEWFRYRQHPGTAALPSLAEEQMAHIRAVLGLTRKVLVADLDNTLWGGVIGEDGLQGIRVGPGSPEGEAYLELQKYLLDLKSRGVLLAVCSKNNPEDARLPFEKHEHMALRLDDFAAFRANWQDKAENIAALAKQLSLGLDSFVFLDDNPLERDWVRSQHRDVALVEPLQSVFHFVQDLDRGRWFYALSVSAEDLERSKQYQVEAQRENLRQEASSFEDFLARLQLEAAVRPVSAANLARVVQLINKTNQFNLTTRRYTEGELKQLLADPCSWAAAFEMTDRMGSYGLIGVMLARSAGAETWEVDTWLMSCRTLGRQMERFMFDRLVQAAVERGISRLIGVYRQTPKNDLVRQLYDQLGWDKLSESAVETRYGLDVPANPVRTATHVRDVSEEAAAR